MLFRFLLWFVGWRMSWLATRDTEFQELIKEKKGAMQVTTVDGKVSRYYFFNNGAFLSEGGLTDEPHITMTFESARFGFSLFLELRKNPMAVMEAMQQQRILVDGDMQFGLWFVGAAKQVFKREKNQ